MHGGPYCSVAESSASIGASTAVQERGRFAVGADDDTDVHRAMTEDRLEVVAGPVLQGRTQQPWQVPLARVADGTLVGRGQVRLPDVPLPGAWPSAAGSSTTENRARGSCRVAGGRAAERATTRCHRAGRLCGSSSLPWNT